MNERPQERIPHDHAVRFYESDAFLSSEVCKFLAEGIAAGERAIVIATPQHRHAFAKQLGALQSDIVMLDADETLARFMVDGMPAWDRFLAVIGPVIANASGPERRKVRAYGEMVDVLWKRGSHRAAIRLEELWNDLREHHELNLLCAYAIDSLYQNHSIAEVCGAHSHVLPRENVVIEPAQVITTLHRLNEEILRRAEVETALRESLAETRQAKDDLEDFLENAVVGIHRVDKNGIIRWANPAELELLGYSRDEYIGQHIAKFHVDAHVINDILARLTRGETLRDYAARLRAKDGSIKYVEISSNVQLKNGEFHTTRCFTRDVTAAEAAERRTALLHKIAVEMSRALTAEEACKVVINESRGLIDANAGAILLLDATRTRTERVVVDGEHDPAVVAKIGLVPISEDSPLAEAARTGKVVWLSGRDAIAKRYPHLTWMRDQVGAVTWGAVPMQFEGSTVGSIGFRMTFERPLTGDEEAILLAVGRQCAQAIERARLHDATQAARAEAEQASRAKDEFLAMLGHELRNPLSPILTAAQLMKTRGDPATMREQKVIERQVYHLIHLVDDLLDISRITRGKIDLDKQPHRIGAIVTKALEICGPACEEQRHRVTVDVPEEDIYVVGDETRLTQVLTNLITNAAKFTSPGGRIDVRIARADNRVRIHVKDDGRGIAPDLLPRIFDLFVQGPRSTDRSRGGLGIGLALVRNLVEMHDGTVTAHSEGPHKGSEFIVELPTVDHRADASSPSFRKRFTVTPRRILVVDDNEDAGSLMGEMLRSIGHEVCVAQDGPRALEALEHFTPEVAILDIGLPVMDGYELAAALLARFGSGVRLMAVTGYGQEQDKIRTQRAGFEAHFVKPVGLGKVLAAIEVPPKA